MTFTKTLKAKLITLHMAYIQYQKKGKNKGCDHVGSELICSKEIERKN